LLLFHRPCYKEDDKGLLEALEMDAELLTSVQNLFNLWETKNLPGELAMTTDGCV